MNSQIKHHICHFLYLILIICYPLYSQQNWTLEAFEKQNVFCLATTHFNDIVAATDSGLYMHLGTGWIKLEDIPSSASDIKMLDNYKMLVTSYIKAQKTTGLYIGDYMWGSGEYRFSLVDTLASLCFIAPRGTNGDTLYAGSSSSIVSTIRNGGGTYSKFTEIYRIEYPNELSALRCFNFDRLLYAAINFDTDSIFGALHYYNWYNSTFKECCAVPFNKLVEGTDEQGYKRLYAASLCGHGFESDGIYGFPGIMMSYPVTKIPTPDNEVINDMIIIPEVTKNGVLCVAIKSGVYWRNNSTWEEIGNIPYPPACIALAECSVGPAKIKRIMAGTRQGLYRIDIPSVGIEERPGKNILKSSITIHSFNKKTIMFSVPKQCHITGSLFNLQGRMITRLFQGVYGKGNHTVDIRDSRSLTRISDDIYFLNLSADGISYVNKLLLLR